LETREIFRILDIIVGLWWAYCFAASVLIWYAISVAKERVEDAVGAWDKLMDARKSEDEPVPSVPKYRTWDVTVCYAAGAALAITGIVCLMLKALEIVVGWCNSFPSMILGG